MSIHAAVVDATSKTPFDKARRGRPAAGLVGDVILHASLRINLEFGRRHWSTKTRVVLSGILIVGIVFRVIDVFLGTIASETLFSDLELGSSISEAHECQDPDKDTNGVFLSLLKGSNIDSLTIVTKPIAEVGSLDVHRRPFVMLEKWHSL